MTKRRIAAIAAAGAFAMGAAPVAAQDFAGAAETAFLFDTMFVLICGFLVMMMAVGFTMLEAGFVRSRNVAMQLCKNVCSFVVTGAVFMLIGYGLAHPDGDWLVEGILSGRAIGANDLETAGATAVHQYEQGHPTVSGGALLFYSMMFCVTTASIVSGAVAERVRLWPFVVFVAIFSGLIYPIQSAWTWGGGFLERIGFVDHAGSVVVHTVGGWAALAGVVILGPRIGKFRQGRVNPMPGSSLPLATLGVLILWFGWFGFNGGSSLTASSVGAMVDVGRVIVNTNAAAIGGAFVAAMLTQAIYRKVDLTLILNGALGGLVSITADPVHPSIFGALAVGAVGGAIVVFAVPMMDRFKLDDVVGAVPVHLGAGIWGGVAAGLSNPDANVLTQIAGIAVIGAFAFVASIVIWFLLSTITAIRFPPEIETEGLDVAELGMEAYPDFVTYETEPSP